MSLDAAMKAIEASTKTCTKCGETKPLTEFFRQRTVKDGRRSDCKVCKTAATKRWQADNYERDRATRKQNYDRNRARELVSAREWKLKTSYGLTLDSWEALFDSQGRTCAICCSAEHGGRNWAVDHCHATGVVRGILCNRCNLVLGHAKDSQGVLGACRDYLRRHHGPR